MVYFGNVTVKNAPPTINITTVMIMIINILILLYQPQFNGSLALRKEDISKDKANFKEPVSTKKDHFLECLK